MFMGSEVLEGVTPPKHRYVEAWVGPALESDLMADTRGMTPECSC